MLDRVVERTWHASGIDEVVVATTTMGEDDRVIAECERLGVPTYRGSAFDLLDRYWQAAQIYGAEAIIRITSDCPLIDPGVIDKVIDVFNENDVDYVSNTVDRAFPRGLDTEIMSNNALGRAWRDATLPYQRVHVTPYIYQNPELFKVLQVVALTDQSHHRWTVDTQNDLDLVRAVYERLGADGAFDWRQVLDLMQREPYLLEFNREVMQKALEEG